MENLIVLVLHDDIIVRLAGVDGLASRALVVGIVDGLEADLAFPALIPLVVLAAAEREVDRLADPAVGLADRGRHDGVIRPVASIGGPQPLQLGRRAGDAGAFRVGRESDLG